MWADAIRAFLEQHRQTYGEETMKPKHHWLLHLPSQLRRDGVLVDTFPLERLHRKVKTYAENCRAAEHYERSIVANCFLAHCRSFEHAPAVDGLLPPILPWGELSLSRASASRKMLFSHLQLVAGDFVFLDGHLVEVQMCCCFENQLAIAAVPWSLVTRTTPNSGVFHANGGPKLCVLAGRVAVAALAWARKDEEHYEVIHT